MADQREKPTQRKRGRKKEGGWGTDSQYLGVRFPPEVMKRLEEAAKVKGWRVGDLVRAAAVEKAAAILNTGGDRGVYLRSLASTILEHFAETRPTVIDPHEERWECDLESRGPIATIVIDSPTGQLDYQPVRPAITPSGPAQYEFANPKVGVNIVVTHPADWKPVVEAGIVRGYAPANCKSESVPEGSPTIDLSEPSHELCLRVPAAGAPGRLSNQQASPATPGVTQVLNLRVQTLHPDTIDEFVNAIRLAGSEWATILQEERRRLANTGIQSRMPEFIDPARILAEGTAGDTDDDV